MKRLHPRTVFLTLLLGCGLCPAAASTLTWWWLFDDPPHVVFPIVLAATTVVFAIPLSIALSTITWQLAKYDSRSDEWRFLPSLMQRTLISQSGLQSTLVFVAMVTVAVFTLSNPSLFAAQTITTTTFLVWIISILVATHARPHVRAFSLGFAITALAYFLLVLSFDEFTNSRKNSVLLTTRLIHAAYIPLGQPVSDGRWGGARGLEPPMGRFLLIGQQLWVLILGFLGGITSTVIRRRVQKSQLTQNLAA